MVLAVEVLALAATTRIPLNLEDVFSFLKKFEQLKGPHSDADGGDAFKVFCVKVEDLLERELGALPGGDEDEQERRNSQIVHCNSIIP